MIFFTKSICFVISSVIAGSALDMKNLKQGHEKPLPDPAICRTQYLGRVVDLSECLVHKPDRCSYALRFGEGVFCRHPDCRSFDKSLKT